MGKKELRILVLEDVEADLVLINHELESGGLACRTKRVESRGEFMEELARDPPDLILSDHGLPNFDGFTALALAREHCPDTPFIFVTGAMGEEVAIDSLRNGATDYVLKTRISNLVPVVKRALQQAEARRHRRPGDVRAEGPDNASEAAAAPPRGERFQTIVETAPVAIVGIDRQGCIRDWNAAAERIFGFTRDQAVGQRVEKLFAPSPAPQKPFRFPESLGGPDTGRFVDLFARRRGGTPFPVEVALSQIGSSPPFFTAFVREITERRKAEEALHRSEARKAAVLEAAPDAIVAIDADDRIIEWNHAAERIFGYSRQLAVGRPLTQLIVPQWNEELRGKGLVRHLQTGRGRTLENRAEVVALRANGGEFPVEVMLAKSPAEDPVAHTLFIHDLSERRRAEEALRRRCQRYRLLVEGVREVAIYMLDPHGRVATWNAGAERITGHTSREIMGRRFHRFFPSEDVERRKPDQALAVATANGHFAEEGWQVRKDGTRYWASLVLTALRDDDGQLTGYSMIARDMTRHRNSDEEIRRLNIELEQRLQERTEELETAYREMETFSYSISHDLRAPLIHIAGFAELLKSELGPELDEKNRRHLQTIAQSAESMGRMITELLTFSRIGRTGLHKVRFKLNDTIQEVRRDLQAASHERNVNWIIADLPEVQADPVMMRQALYHLLANALKFTRRRDEARIEVTARAYGGEHIFAVRDNGVGFDMKYAAKLFGVFHRLHPAADFEGTGIGLANVRRIIQRHGGRTWAEGEVNVGATFYFSLPLPAARGSHDRP